MVRGCPPGIGYYGLLSNIVVIGIKLEIHDLTEEMRRFSTGKMENAKIIGV